MTRPALHSIFIVGTTMDLSLRQQELPAAVTEWNCSPPISTATANPISYKFSHTQSLFTSATVMALSLSIRNCPQALDVTISVLYSLTSTRMVFPTLLFPEGPWKFGSTMARETLPNSPTAILAPASSAIQWRPTSTVTAPWILLFLISLRPSNLQLFGAMASVPSSLRCSVRITVTPAVPH